MMKELAKRIAQVAELIERSTGKMLDMVGIFQHGLGAGNWDILFAAPWLDDLSMKESLDLLLGSVAPKVDEVDYMSIRSVSVVQSDSSFVREILSDYGSDEYQENRRAGDGVTVVNDVEIGGVPIRKGYIVVARSNHPLSYPGQAEFGFSQATSTGN